MNEDLAAALDRELPARNSVSLVALGRCLVFRVGSTRRHVSVCLYADEAPPGGAMIAYATGSLGPGAHDHYHIERPKPEETALRPTLWIGAAAFDLAPGEAEQIEALIAARRAPENNEVPP